MHDLKHMSDESGEVSTAYKHGKQARRHKFTGTLGKQVMLQGLHRGCWGMKLKKSRGRGGGRGSGV